MTEYSEIFHELADELGIALPKHKVATAVEYIDNVFDNGTDEITLPSLTLKIIRTLLPLFSVKIQQGSTKEHQLVNALQLIVVKYIV